MAGLRRSIVIAGFGLLVVVLAGQFYRYLAYVAVAVAYPYGLDYGEGIVWEQARLMLGPRMYGDINVYPHIVFHYPPVFHLAARLAALPGFDLLTTGRVLSVAAGLAIGGLLAGLAWMGTPRTMARPARAFGAAVAGLLAFVPAPFVIWSPLMRVDMLALALGFAGVALAVGALRRPGLIHAAAVAFTLAVYCKQTCVWAPIASFAVLLAHDRRLALRGIATGLVLSLGLLALLSWWTDGGFLRHILLYNVNRFSLGQVVDGAATQLLLLPLLLVAVAGCAAGVRFLGADWRARIGDGGAGTVTAIVLLHFVLAGLSLVTLGKKGAAVNYFIEWMCLWCLLAGPLVARWLDAALRAPRFAAAVGALLLPVVLVCQVMLAGRPSSSSLTSPRARAEMAELAAMVRGADKPVMSDDMVLLLRAGKEIPLEPIIFADLALKGLWDEGILLGMVAGRRFAFIVTDDGGPDESLYQDRFTAPVRAEIARSYPLKRRLGRYTVRSPSG